MRRTIVIWFVCTAFATLLPASEFDWLVREFSRQTGARQTHIPLFGLVRFCVWAARPAGTSELRLAVFEHASLEPERFSSLTDTVTGVEWKPMVRVRSRHSESTNIYVQEHGKDLRLLVTSFEGQEATFVQVRIRPEQLIKFIDNQRCSKHGDM
jgi:hypothetical protein